MGIKGKTDDNIRREPVLGLVYHGPGVLEIETRYKGVYFYDKSSDPPSDTTYVLWNNGGVLTFGSVPMTLWNDDGSSYLYPVTDGRGIELKDSTGLESAYIIRNASDMIINGGVGGNVLIQFQGTSYIGLYSTPEVRIQNASLYQWDSETYPLTVQNDAGTKNGYIKRTNTIFQFDADDGSAYVSGVSGVFLEYNSNTFLGVDNDGADFIGIYRDLRIRGTPAIQGYAYFYNMAASENAYIYKTDTKFEIINPYDYIVIDGETGNYIRVNSTNVMVITATGVENYQNFVMFDGKYFQAENATNTEFGYIQRDDDYFYFKSGTGGEFAIQREATTYIYSGANLVIFSNASIKQMDSETYPLVLENDAGTETSTVYRNDNGIIISIGTGGLAAHVDGSFGMGYITAFLPGPTDRYIFDAYSMWGMTVGGRVEQGAAYFEDDFWSGQLRQEWNLVAGATGSTAALASYGSGWITITTGAIANDVRSYDWNSIYDFNATRRPTFEMRLKLGAVANYRIRVGLQGSNPNDFVWFEFDTSNASNPGNWHAMVRYDSGAGAESDYDTGIAATTNEVVLRFEFSADDEVRFIIDGAPVATSTVTANVPQSWLQPVIYLEALAGAAISSDFDYVKFWQDRI